MEGCRNILPLLKKITMPKRYFILITLMTLLVVVVLATRSKPQEVPVLLERNTLLAADDLDRYKKCHSFTRAKTIFERQ